MSNLVRVRHEGVEFNVGRAHAEAKGFEVLEESPRQRDGQLKPVTRENGRPRKPKTSVADKAAEKKAAESAAKPDNTPSEES